MSYNPAGMAGAIASTGIWGTPIPVSVPSPVFGPVSPIPLDYTLPIIRIAPNDSVPKTTAGPTPGASWWAQFQESVDNGSAWVADRLTLLGKTAGAVLPQEQPDPAPTPAETNGATMLLIAGALAILFIKAR